MQTRRALLSGSVLAAGLLLGYSAQAQAPAGAPTFATYAAMQSAGSMPNGTPVWLTSYLPITDSAHGPGIPVGGGLFSVDTSDTTTADDGGMCCVTAAGQRLKRVTSGYIAPEMFGAVVFWGANNSFGIDSAPAWRAMASWLANGGHVPRRVFASSGYLCRTADPANPSTCIQFRGGGIILQSDRSNSEANNSANTLVWDGPTNAVIDSLISLAEDGMTMYNVTADGANVPDKVLFLSASSFPSRMDFMNCRFSNGKSYAVYGGVWGSTWDTCVFTGGAIGCFCLNESTSHHMVNCYAVGGGTFGYSVAGFYGTLTDMSCDNVGAGGVSYILQDRTWIVSSLACENGQKLLLSTADNLISNGNMTLQDTMPADWIKIGGGNARLFGFMPAADVNATPIVQVVAGASLSTDLPYSQMRLVDGSANDLGFGEQYAAAIHSSATNGSQSNNPGVTGSLPLAGPRLGAVLNQQTVTLFNLSAGTVAAADVLSPIAHWTGVGRNGFSGTYGGNSRQILKLTKPFAHWNIDLAEWFYENIDFQFDLNDATKDAFSLWNVRRLLFNNCTFTFLSPARSVFGGYTPNPFLANAKVVLYPNNKLAYGGLVGTNRGGKTVYWRAAQNAPSQFNTNTTDSTILFETVKWPSLPVDTLWDGDVDLHLEEPDAQGYLGSHVTVPGWIGASPPVGAPIATIKRYNQLA